MMRMFAIIPVFFVAVSARAQVLTTAEPLGEGKQLVLLTQNHLYDTGSDPHVDLNIAYVMYVKNLLPRFDLYVSAGETHVLGEDQAFVGVGGNLKVLAFMGNSVSLFGVASVPLHRRSESAIVLANPAVIISRALSPKISFYSGVNALIRVRPHGSQDLFTPLENKINVPVGTALTFGSWGIYAEADLGARLKAMGFGLSKAF